MVEFDPSKFVGKMNLSYSVNDARKNQAVNFDLTKKSEVLVSSVINFLKSQGNPRTEKEDFVENLHMKMLIDEAKVEERLWNFFARVGEKVRTMKRDRDHSNYMKLFNDIRVSKISLE